MTFDKLGREKIKFSLLYLLRKKKKKKEGGAILFWGGGKKGNAYKPF